MKMNTKKYGIDKNETTVINGKNSLQIENKTRKIDNIVNDDNNDDIDDVNKIDAKKIVVVNSNKGNLEGSINIQKTYSVVQDWHLVCKQLCGAGLGGPTCGEPTCNEIKKEASLKYNITEKANQLLENKSEEICQDLCQHQLGDDICACGKRIHLIDNDNNFSEIDSNDILILEHNQICQSFCKYNDITITGCSKCSKDNDDDIDEKEISSITEIIQTKLTPTTPNWEKICKELCKSGDGGSLCNCDKPPFF